MQSPEIPVDEADRLESLQALNILDTLPEERFDRLTRMAKRLLGVPISLVSLVDHDRQWFKSRVGLDATETPRDISFCGHTILGNEVFAIPDASKDKRFADNPLVLNNPNIRLYAGAPLKAPDGQKLGTLCIIDEQPRVLSEEDIAALKDLAAMVECEIAAIQMATLDELTRIPNRRGFLTMAEHSLSLCVRQKMPVSLVFLDLNGFKPINDEFGHAEGDRALVGFAVSIRRALRDSDVFARIGGDEFVLLLVNTGRVDADGVVAKCTAMLEEYNEQTDSGYEVAFSHGIVEFDKDRHADINELLAEADALMYEHKQSDGSSR